MKEDMLTLTAAADFLQISPEVLCRHAKNGVIPAHKEGRTWRFSRKELKLGCMTVAPRLRRRWITHPGGSELHFYGL
jgi:excisionase family DNA binding protein